MSVRRLFLGLFLATTGAVAGCQGQAPEGNPLEESAARSAPAASPADGEFNEKISQVMNETSAKYRALEYDYNENLLTILDQVEQRLSNKTDKLDPLPFKTLDEAEQLDVFREVFRQWAAKTGKTLRTELDALKADVAARKPGGPVFHPEFQKKFSASFDELIPIEVAEMRRRRNVALHNVAKPLLDEYRAKAPDAVKNAERTLNEPPYALEANPTAAPAEKKAG